MKDAFDAEPLFDLLPRRIQRWLARFALALIALVPGASGWLIQQAQIHVEHQMQPLIARLTVTISPSTTTSLGPSSPSLVGRP